MVIQCTQTISGIDITLETGKMAKQANGSVVLTCGDLVLLATATMSKKAKEGIDFLPLTIEYSEKMYASGKIPGGFFKRENRPSVRATLTARLIDRPLRPRFPKYFHHDVQVVVTVMSYDPSVSIEPLAILAASAALEVSDIPFLGPVSAAHVGYINGQLKVNPTMAELDASSLNLVVAGTKDAILMVEAGANEVSEEMMIEAFALAHQSIRETIALQEQLRERVSPVKRVFESPVVDTALESQIQNAIGSQIEENLRKGDKLQTELFLDALEASVKAQFVSEDKQNEAQILQIYNKLKKAKIRQLIIRDKLRPDGRRMDEIRPISIEVGLLPAAHGSALFTRGETQSLGVLTLGTGDDEQIEDGLGLTERKDYYFHYNFPPFSVGECGMMRTGRRELGHGALAERALRPILPDKESFPYTKRLVSEILESNGSSSMASVCSGSLALMDAGAPISGQVSGIAMGLLLDDSGHAVLSDIQGLEDHYGDMDFKVAGTAAGITALQLDIKVAGLTETILKEALYQAKEGRLFILKTMNAVLDKPRTQLSKHAPKIVSIMIDPTKIGMVIGSGGKTIRKIEEDTGAEVIIGEGNTGLVSIAAPNQESLDQARMIIENLVRDIQKGDVFTGKVVKIATFGAFIELVPGKEGLLHISKISDQRIENVEDVLAIGDRIEVEVAEVDRMNRINLMRHGVLS